MKYILSIPSYNLLNETKNLIKEIYSSASFDFEIIVIDNGSQENFNELYQFKNLQMIRNQINMSVSHAWNQAIDYALSKNYDLILLNNDIVLRNDTLNNLVKFASKTTKYGLICATAYEDFDTLKTAIPTHFTIENQHNFALFLIKQFVMKEIGHFDDKNFPDYFNDYDYLNRLKNNNIYFCTYTGSLFYHLESLTTKKYNLNLSTKYNHSLLNYIKKWGSPPNAESLKSPHFQI